MVFHCKTTTRCSWLIVCQTGFLALHVPTFAQFVMPQPHKQNRFAEWSSACLEMQLDKLNSESNAANLHYMGIFLDDDTAMSVKTAGNVAGKLMSSWWDQCEEAGSKRRPHSSFDVPLPTLEVLTVSDGICRTLTFKKSLYFFICCLVFDVVLHPVGFWMQHQTKDSRSGAEQVFVEPCFGTRNV